MTAHAGLPAPATPPPAATVETPSHSCLQFRPPTHLRLPSKHRLPPPPSSPATVPVAMRPPAAQPPARAPPSTTPLSRRRQRPLLPRLRRLFPTPNLPSQSPVPHPAAPEPPPSAPPQPETPPPVRPENVCPAPPVQLPERPAPARPARPAYNGPASGVLVWTRQLGQGGRGDYRRRDCVGGIAARRATGRPDIHRDRYEGHRAG